MFVIGKTKNPGYFNKVKFLLCRYRNQQKSWMDRVLFKEKVKEMDKKFVSEGRKVALVVGNCPTLTYPWELKIDQVVFPPAEHNFSDSTSEPECDSLTESTVP